MYCGGGHLGFPIGIKNRKFLEDLPMIIPRQFGFNYPSVKVLYKIFVFYACRKSKMATTAVHRLTLDPMGKYSKEDHPMNIHVQFGFNNICSF
jgi:hypothetical protein